MPETLTESAFNVLWDRCCNWGRWGAADVRGTLNHITDENTLAATQLVRHGRTLSLARALDVTPAVDNPRPVVHRTFDAPPRPGRVQFVNDSLTVECHGHAHSHIDALGHVVVDGRTYNDRPYPDDDSVLRSQGGRAVTIPSIEAMADGVVSRGLLLDIPRLRGIDWLEPGDAVLPADIESAELDTGLRVRSGDVVLLRTGHQRRRIELGPWDVSQARAGLHPAVLPLFHARGVALVGIDGDPDTIPSLVVGVRYPVLAIGTAAMGMPFLDSLALDELAHACEMEGRWEFLLAIAPLRVANGTGSPVNPIAVL